MVLKTTKKDNQSIISIHSLSLEVSEKSIKQVFSSLLKYIIYNYMDNKETVIPYLGMVKIEHKDDEIRNGLNEAQLTITIDPNDFITKVIGQIDDNNVSDIDEFLIQNIGYELEKHLEK